MNKGKGQREDWRGFFWKAYISRLFLRAAPRGQVAGVASLNVSQLLI